MDNGVCRVRLRLPSGAELEVRGARDFVEGEIRSLLGRLEPPPASHQQHAPAPPILQFDWKSLAEARGQDLILRAKNEGGPLEAALLLMLASDKLLAQPRPIATQLARWIRSSGYAVGRIDRLLALAVRRGDVLASGTKRARRYELSPTGKTRAVLAAERLLKLLPASQGD